LPFQIGNGGVRTDREVHFPGKIFGSNYGIANATAEMIKPRIEEALASKKEKIEV